MVHDKITTHAGGKAGACGRSPARRLPRAPSAACQRAAAALHGPGRWHHAAPDEVPWIVRRWLRGHPQAPDELRAYAVQASAGRPAYDGDRPKWSHRTERLRVRRTTPPRSPRRQRLATRTA
jgi:hypothetical protein